MKALVLLLVLTTTAAGATRPAARPATQPSAAELKLADAANELGLKTFARLSADDGNVVLSPASLCGCALLLRAAANDVVGHALDEAVAWRLPPQERYTVAADWADRLQAAMTPPRPEWAAPTTQPNIARPQVSIAQSLWRQQGDNSAGGHESLIPPRLIDARHTADFSAADRTATAINAWIDAASDGRLRNVLKPGDINPATQVMAVNVLRFRGQWKDRFNEDETKVQPFTTASGLKVDVPMMREEDIEADYYRSDHVQLVVLPYQTEGEHPPARYGMVLLLPTQADMKLDAVEKQLSTSQLKQWLTAAKPTEAAFEAWVKEVKAAREKGLSDEEGQKLMARCPQKLVTVTMPRFKLTGKCDLSDAIPNLRRESVTFLQSTFVAVDEKGTEAAAASAGSGLFGGPTGAQVTFTVDRPFLFLIVDEVTGTILFIGRVNDPTK